MFFEKHTEKHIEEIIEKKSDIEKEENLKFIEQLNKEARQSFKTMIAIGLDSWKKLTTKDKSLYFESAIPEDEADHNLSNEDLDAQNRMLAANELGETFTPEDLTAFCASIDTDHDGFIDFSEFKSIRLSAWWNSNRPTGLDAKQLHPSGRKALISFMCSNNSI